jgi:hypothetical protein
MDLQKGSNTDCSTIIIKGYLLYQLHIKCYPYPLKVKPIIDDINHQCGFQCDGLTSDNIFRIPQILEKKWLSIDFK